MTQRFTSSLSSRVFTILIRCLFSGLFLLGFSVAVSANDAEPTLIAPDSASFFHAENASDPGTGPAVDSTNSGGFNLDENTPEEPSVASTARAADHPDYQALVDLYNNTNGPSWLTRQGWLTNTNPCSGWYGVFCDQNRVTSVNLSSNRLNGTIPASLGNLTNLTNLYLAQNQLTGSIPSSLGNLTGLRYLFLARNRLSGSIPTTLGNLTNLLQLSLAENQLTGSIPTTLGSLTKLQYLYLNENQLTGSIPTTLGSLVNLKYLLLNINGLSGSIPTTFGQLTSLEYLDLAENQLSGTIPATLGSLTNLLSLELQSNQLTGIIPARLGSMTNLQSLWLDDNQLTGSIPSALGDLTNLRSLGLHTNKLTGGIPASLGSLANLQTLYLHSNQLGGCYPASLTARCDININFAGNTGLPDGGSTAAFETFCATGQGGDSFVPTITATPSSLPVGGVVSLRTAGGSSYTWRAPAGAVLSSTTNGTVSATITSAGNHTFTVVVGQGGSCSQTATASVSSATVMPTLSTLVGPSGTVCSGSIATFSATVGNISGTYSYTLSNGADVNLQGTSSASAFSQNVTIGSTTSLQVFTLTVNSGGGIRSTTASLSVKPSPTATITPSSATLTCANPNNNLTAGGGGNYRWDNGSTSAVRPVTNSGVYSVTVTASNGCSNVATITLAAMSTHPDYQALVDLYNSTNGQGWTRKKGWFSNCDPCKGWEGVECAWTDRVTSLSLRNNRLKGTIPASIGSFSGLKWLSLSDNELSGSIPASIGNLNNLTDLYISGNQLTGSIPASLGSLAKVEGIDFSLNQLTGSIPSTLGSLTTLQDLRLHYNKLTGSIPSSLGSLSNVRVLHLYGNQLSGSIPASLGSLPKVVQLFLHENRLSGSIPASLGSLPSIDFLHLGDNKLSGCFPASLRALCNVQMNFMGNVDLPGGGGWSALAALCETGQGTDTFIPTATTSFSSLPVGGVVSLSTASGGSSYTWKAPAGAVLSSTTSKAVSATLTSAGNHTFTLVVGQSSNCSQTATVSVNATLVLPTLSALVATSEEVCTGSVATFSATVGNISGSYSYTLTNGADINLQGTSSASAFSQNVTIGSATSLQLFTLTIRSGGSSKSAAASLTVKPLPTATISPASSTLTCATPSVSLTANGGSSYRWDNNSTNAVRTITTAGTYSVTATAGNGCSAVATRTISSNATPPTAVITPSSFTLSCATPSVSLTASGGSSYRWDNNSTNAVRIITTAGTYSVTATAGNGCSAVATRTISSNATPPTAVIIPSSATLSCATPSVSLTASGGSSYRWDNNSTNAVRIITTAGTYSVTVTAGNGCSATKTVTVSGSTTPPTATISPSSATLTCATPSVSLTASGGSSYRWNNNSTNAVRTITTAGTYSVTVTSGNGCSSTQSVTVSNNKTTHTATISPSSATLTCATPSVSLTASGGVSYRWDNNSTNALRTITTAGTYSVTVTAGNGCSATKAITISGNTTAPTATITPSSATLTCATPSVSLTASGGTSYRWDNNSTNAVRTVTTAGIYSVTVTNGSGCSATKTVTISGSTDAPTALITPSSATLSCASPSFNLTASGGTSYRWEDNSTNAVRTVTTAGTYSVTVTNGNGCSATKTVTISGNTTAPTATISPSSATISCASPSVSLTASGGSTYRWEDNSTNAVRTVTTAGTYSVTVTNGSGCSATKTVTISGSTDTPTAVITPSSATLSCATPSVSLTASGGTSYRWEDNSTNAVRSITTAGTYSVTVTAGNGCSATKTVTVSGSTTPPTATISPSSATLTCASPSVSLTASGGSTYRWENNSINAVRSVTTSGTYSVTVTSGNGCLATKTVTISGSTDAPTAVITPSSATLTCESPSVSLTASGGSAYRWEDNSINAVRSVTTSGTYSVTVTSAGGCTAVKSVTISGSTDVPTASISPSSATLTCESPSVSLTASGGSAYRWEDNSTNAVRTITTAGTYSVTVTNGNGCSATKIVTISGSTDAPTAVIAPSSATLSCATPSVSLTASGGSTYRWEDNSTNAVRTITTAGTYSVTVTSAGGCTAVKSVTITGSTDVPTASISPSSATLTCESPSVSLTASGGSAYRWEDNSTNAVRTITTAGTYSVTVTSGNGCLATKTVTISGSTDAPTAVITPSSATLNCASPLVSLTASGGSTYRWEDNSTNAVRTVTTAGTYSVTVTAGNGCSATKTVTVSGSTTPPTATISPSSATLTCASPSVSLTASGGSTYRWEDNSTNAVRTITTAGTYSVTVTNGNGCWATKTVTISGSTDAPTAVITPSSATLNCASPLVSLTASGGSTYRWEDNSTNAVRSVTTSGTYSVTVTSAGGCTAVKSVTISGSTDVPTASISPSSATLTCESPSVSLTASGGSTYRWEDNSTKAVRTVTTAGIYSVTVTNGSGCSATKTVTISGSTDAPTALITPSSATLTCASPSVSLTASGGSTYRWEDNSTNANRTVTTAGTYSVTVTNGNGCSATKIVTISGSTDAPTAGITPSSATLSCSSPSVSLTASGGSTYRWEDNSTNAVRTVTTAGTYSVTVTSGNGCLATKTVTISGNTTAPTATISPSSATISCASPSVSLTASGGSTYRWEDNSTNAVRTVTTAGIYSVTVTAGNGCLATKTVTISGSTEAPAIPNLTSTTVTQGTPSVTLTASNCSGALSWTATGGATGTGPIIVSTNNPGAFVYQVSCTTNGCSSSPASVSVVVTAPAVTGSFDGFIYGADCATFRGWVWDRNKANTPISVDILDNGEPIATLMADQFRQDLLDAGKGNGRHAFIWSIPDVLKDGVSHSLSARVTDNGFLLKNAPKAILCHPNPEGNKPPQPPAAMAPLVTRLGVSFSTSLPVFTDPDGGTLTYALTGLPTGLSFNPASRTISGTPTEEGIFALAYQASDEQGANNSVSIQLTVNPGETTAITGSFEGYLDKLDCGGIRGWVWDRNKPNTPLTVEFYLEPSAGTIEVLGSVVANIYRQDLKDAGKGNGAHVYTFSPPANVTNGTMVKARVLGSSFILKGSPKAYQCNAPARLSAEEQPELQVTVLGNPVVGDALEFEVRGAEGKPVQVLLTNVSGRLVLEHRVEKAGAVESIQLSLKQQPAGLWLLRVVSDQRSLTQKIQKR